MAEFYDVIIIGSGPAGLTAAIYLGRAGQKCVILEKEFPGGYTAKIADIENYPGHEAISGFDLTAIMQKQAENFGAKVLFPVEVVDIELKGDVKRVRTRDEVYEAHAIIIAIGVARKKLDVPGAKADEIDILINGNMLTISGERKEASGKKGRTFHRVERRCGDF